MSFLALEPLIIDRLREAVPDLRAVYTAREAADVLTRREVSPAAHVIYGGFQVAEVMHAGLAARLNQVWLIVITATSAKGGSTGAGPREIAGPLMVSTMRALLGWKPAPGCGRLLLAASPQARHLEGFSYFPLTFTSQVIVQAEMHE